MQMTQIAVITTASALTAKAEGLAGRLNLNLLDQADPNIANYSHLLVLTPNWLGIQQTHAKKFAPFYIDFLSGKMQYRRKQAGLRKELLARALGKRPQETPTIIDATAGLGRDSFILATLGYTISLLERSPILFELLQDALRRAKTDPTLAPIVERMHLIRADAIQWLPALPQGNRPDIIYLDPMFPERKKSASVKKEMVFLQELLGKDTDCDKLLAVALTCAKQRVVVKRPKLAANVAERAPNFMIAGKSSRFDIYLV